MLNNPGPCADDVYRDALHLLYIHKHNLARNEPPDAFGARGARKTARIRPELVEQGWSIEKCKVQLHWDASLRVGPADAVNGGRIPELIEELAVRLSWIETDCEHRPLVAHSIAVHYMKLSLGPVTSNRMICRTVNMPALEVNCGIVKAELRVIGVVSLHLVEKGECRPVAPVVEVAPDQGAIGKRKFRVVRSGQALIDWKCNGRLLGASLADRIV
ncbi:hypothetical protein FH972_026320 [Carpinus fangiana]|uniref:Uncharacterized protein n=1 Tax=Carpinus fangiana TaxID=176857 RepID=A0A5N6L3S3_9ROSI|nr:hypothetical protein FH972_026320 [Carpinus fangiana]